MKKAKQYISLFLLLTCITVSCKKEDPAKSDARLSRPYCNQPEAINYNWDFPGTVDNTTCFYPTEVFRGSYYFIDSIFNEDYKPNTPNPSDTYNITLHAVSNTKMLLTGMCILGDSLKMTADRYYKANLDSLAFTENGIEKKINGQYLCTQRDTISGYMIKEQGDNGKLTIFFTVATDSGYNFHRGTAIKK